MNQYLLHLASKSFMKLQKKSTQQS